MHKFFRMHTKKMFFWLFGATNCLLLQSVSPAAYFAVSSVMAPVVVLDCFVRHRAPTAAELLAAALCTVLCIGVAMSVCLHRYFSHSAFSTSRPVQFVLGVCGCLAFQGDPLWWAVMHKRHHKHCDMVGDPHSSARDGVFYAVVGWMANPANYQLSASDFETINPAACTPEMHALRHLHPLIHVLAFATAQLYAGYATMVYCCLLPMWLTRFITLLFNHEFHQGTGAGALCLAEDATRILAIAVGESKHADHHKHPRRARRPELDPPWHMTVRWMRAVGLVWACH